MGLTLNTCEECGRPLERRRGKADGQPSFCHRSVSPECYSAYRRWRYHNDPTYKTAILKSNLEWKRDRRQEADGAPTR